MTTLGQNGAVKAHGKRLAFAVRVSSALVAVGWALFMAGTNGSWALALLVLWPGSLVVALTSATIGPMHGLDVWIVLIAAWFGYLAIVYYLAKYLGKANARNGKGA